MLFEVCVKMLEARPVDTEVGDRGRRILRPEDDRLAGPLVRFTCDSAFSMLSTTVKSPSFAVAMVAAVVRVESDSSEPAEPALLPVDNGGLGACLLGPPCTM